MQDFCLFPLHTESRLCLVQHATTKFTPTAFAREEEGVLALRVSEHLPQAGDLFCMREVQGIETLGF